VRRPQETLTIDATSDTDSDKEIAGAPVPGLVLIFSADKPACEVIPLVEGAVEIGRGEIGGDKRMSRRHARITFDGRRFTVRDWGSHNGTSIDGEPLPKGGESVARRLLQAGASLFLLATDITPFRQGVTTTDGGVRGPSLHRALRGIERAARFGRVVHVMGESGSGKELAARAFHNAGPASGGPFVAVNAATLPEGLAERLLFGAKKGAYSGAVDAVGHVQSAHRGTLFLDEVADLNPQVQAKLLRVLETSEVMPLGATRADLVDMRLVSATHKDLRLEVAEGRMREDLFFRIGVPAVGLPPLRDRPEEIPWLIERALKAVSDRAGGAGSELRPHVSLVEACLRRAWPGNIRELLAEVGAAAQLALEEGGQVMAQHLSPSAGTVVRVARPSPSPAPQDTAPPQPAAPPRPSDEAITEALRAAGGNVSRAARELGMHRTQLYRWIARKEGRADDGGGDPSKD
jgi:DNA-binding NtrC family response regulator